MAPQSFGPDTLKPDSADYIVYALARLEEQIKAQDARSTDRYNDTKQRFDDFLNAARERGKLYEHRDHEWTRQIENMTQQLAKLTELSSRLIVLDEDVKDLSAEVHALHADQQAMDKRIQSVEACKAQVEQHFRDTAQDHLTMSNTRSRMKALAWLGASLVLIATSIGGMIPLVEWLWPKR